MHTWSRKGSVERTREKSSALERSRSKPGASGSISIITMDPPDVYSCVWYTWKTRFNLCPSPLIRLIYFHE